MRIEARQAAAWWASRLGDCTHDAGMRNVAEMELTVSLNAAAVRGRFDAETVDLFAQHLEVAVEQALGAVEGRLVLSTEYEPCLMLLQAARAAGIELDGDLPVKTRMIVERGEVRVKEGYSGRWTVLGFV